MLKRWITTTFVMKETIKDCKKKHKIVIYHQEGRKNILWKKEDLQEQARKKYRDLFSEVNDTKRKHGRNQRRNMPKEDKQKQKQMKWLHKKN